MFTSLSRPWFTSARLATHVLALVLCIGALEAQTRSARLSGIELLSPLWQVNPGSEHAAAGRATVAVIGLSSAALVNPATISSPSFRMTVDGSYRSPAAYLAGITYRQGSYLPSLVTISLPLGPTVVQVGYARTYDELSHAGPIPLTTQANPEGNGEYITFEQSTVSHTPFAAVMVGGAGPLRAGLTVGLDILSASVNALQDEEFARGTRLRLTAGALADLSDDLRIGIAVRLVQDGELGYVGPLLRTSPSYTGPRYVARSPLEVELGMRIEPVEGIEAIASVQYEKWPDEEDSENRLQMHAGLRIAVLPWLDASAGLFSQTSPFDALGNFYSQQFLTAGVGADIFADVRVHLSCITSGLFSRSAVHIPYWEVMDSFHRTEVLGGIAVGF